MRGLPEDPHQQGLLMAASCQALETWGPTELNLGADELQVYALADPEELDLLLICGTDPQMRSMIRRWLPAAASDPFGAA